jgi:ribonucleoside-diphosphate reductase alpha chain
MLCRKYPSLTNEIQVNVKFIRQKKILPSMRALQFAGPAMEINNARGYNCCYLPVDSLYAFSETMFLLLGGTGVGYSVQKHHVAQLGAITRPKKTRRYLIQDSIIGWADAVKVLMKAYLQGKSLPIFDFSDIRAKGTRLVTAGGKAPGPEPLKKCLFEIQLILDRKQDGEHLSTTECHDIMCHIANAVLAGGIRRAAMIALFSHDDIDMLECKYGKWWELNEQRGRANNSAVLKRGEISEQEFFNLWKKIELSGSGEPGFYWTDDIEWGTNPCCEVALRPFQFCNLCEINADNIENQEDLNKRAEVAAFFGTLQAGFTDFHYLRPIWETTTKKDALVGVGMTGIASGKVLTLDLTEAAKIVKLTNAHYAPQIGINEAARTTLVKPSGTTSLVLGSSSGIHAWYWNYILRTVRFNMNEDVANYMLVNHPELCEVDKLNSNLLCVRVPMKAPEGAILRTESPIELLERVKKFSIEWIKPGHKEGINTHNVSATISIKEKEWEEVGNWMWKNKDHYNGLSVMPYDGGTYVQTPFENITEEEYNIRLSHLIDVELSKVSEIDDNTAFTQTEACAGGKCEI